MSAPSADTPPLAVDAKRLAKMLGQCLRTIRTWDGAGYLPSPVRVGPKRVLWRVAEIQAWLEAGSPDRASWLSLRPKQFK